MTLDEVAKKYGVSTAFLNTKTDAIDVTIESLKDLQQQLKDNQPRHHIVNRTQFIIDFLTDVKQSNR